MESFQDLTAASSFNFNLDFFDKIPLEYIEPMMEDIEEYINSLTRFGEEEEEADEEVSSDRLALASIHQNEDPDDINPSPSLSSPCIPTASSNSHLRATGLNDVEDVQSAFQTYARENVRHRPLDRLPLEERHGLKDVINTLELEIDIGINSEIVRAFGIDEDEDAKDGLWTEWLEVNDDGWVTDNSIQMVQRIASGELNHDPNPSDNEYDPGDEEQNDEEEDSSFFGDTEECMDVLTMSGLSSADKDLITPWMPVSSKLFYFATDSSSDDCTESEFNADDEFGAV